MIIYSGFYYADEIGPRKFSFYFNLQLDTLRKFVAQTCSDYPFGCGGSLTDGSCSSSWKNIVPSTIFVAADAAAAVASAF
jgi:hypothetical protein